MDSDARADTFARYLATVQWAIRPTTLVPDQLPIGDLLPVDCLDIRPLEVKRVVKRLRLNKSGGLDGALAEYFKALCADSRGLEIVTRLC